MVKTPERVNAVMNGMVAMLTTEDDMKAMAAYFAGQELKPESAKNSDTIVLRPEALARATKPGPAGLCRLSRVPAGAGPTAQASAPVRQFSEYIEAQLKLFRSGNVRMIRQMMRMIAIKMTDPEIKAVSDYAAWLALNPAFPVVMAERAAKTALSVDGPVRAFSPARSGQARDLHCTESRPSLAST